jgi:hypothetical protein
VCEGAGHIPTLIADRLTVFLNLGCAARGVGKPTRKFISGFFREARRVNSRRKA